MRHFSVSAQQDKQDIAHLKQVNAELTASLQRCRELLLDCRSKLAANSNHEQLSGYEGSQAEARR
jgi:hypothetical protein